MTSVVTPINAGFAEAHDSALSQTMPWNAKSPINIRIGHQLQIRRVSCGISDREFSEQLGIARDDLRLYESGEKRISANLLLQIARLLKVRLVYFFEDNRKEDCEAP
jgi:hypothetical protein